MNYVCLLNVASVWLLSAVVFFDILELPRLAEHFQLQHLPPVPLSRSCVSNSEEEGHSLKVDGSKVQLVAFHVVCFFLGDFH